MKTPNNIQVCTQCNEDAEAENLCKTCQEYLCEECTKAHRRTKVTKDHLLEKLTNRLNEGVPEFGNNLNSILTHCDEDKHANVEITQFCVNCGKPICEICRTERHNSHIAKPIEIVYKEQFESLSELCFELQNTDFQKLNARLDQNISGAQQNKEALRTTIDQHFDALFTVLHNRQSTLLNDVDNVTEMYVKQVEQMIHDVTNEGLQKECTSKVAEVTNLLRETNRVIFVKLFSELSDQLQQLKKMIPVPHALNLTYKEGCSLEDFTARLAQLGSIQEPASDNTEFKSVSYVSQDDLSSTKSHHMDVLKSTTSLTNLAEPCSPWSQSTNSRERLEQTKMKNGQSSASPNNVKTHLKEEHVDDDLKMNSLKAVPVSVNSNIKSRGELSGGRNLLGNAREVPETITPYQTLDETLSMGQLLLIDSDYVRTIVRKRFETWSLDCSYVVERGKITVTGPTKEDCQKARQILKDTVLEDVISFNKGSKYHWHTITSQLMQTYSKEVQVEIADEQNKIFIYATCSVILKDARDAIRIYIRDNQLRTITMHYPESVVKYVMRHKRALEKIQNKWSKARVEISEQEATRITVTGAVVGVGQAVRSLHIIASKMKNQEEVDRFDSDDTDDDDEMRFSDEDESSPAGPLAGVRLMMSSGISQVDVRALVFLENNRLLYVVAGDITQLPIEALTNPADTKLKHNGGLAKIIVEKGGRIIQEECTLHVQASGVVPEGQVFCSSAGTLPCTIIIHAVGPRYQDGNHGEIQTLSQVVTNCLQNTTERKLTSIALSAISTGTFRFPVDQATSTIVGTIADFLNSHPACSLREVYLCDKTQETVNAFTTAVKSHFDKHSYITAEASSPGQPLEEARARLYQSLSGGLFL